MALAIPFPEFDPVIFNIGPLPIRWYAVSYMLGLALGWLYVARIMQRERLWAGGKPPMDHRNVDDLLLFVAIGVVLGGRLGYVIFYNPELLWPEPWRALMVWEGGMSFHGGMAAVAIVVLLYGRMRGVSALRVGDAVAVAAPIGLFFGRLANFINGELWGRPTEVSWGMVFPQVEEFGRDYPWLLGPNCVAPPSVDCVNLPRHPSQLYEAGLEGLLLFVVLALLVFRFGALMRTGLCTGVFLIGYGLTRGFVEFFRQWDPHLGFDFYLFGVGFTRGQTLCIPMIAIGVWLLVRALRRPAAPEGARSAS